MSEREFSSTGPTEPADTVADAPHARAEKPARLSRGTLVGRYVVLDVLGEGGMGVVYRAVDPDLDRRLAIKLMHASSGQSAWLAREAQALAKLSHPNVVAVYDVGALADGRPFVAMELVEGATLRAWLRERTRTWREVIAVLRAAGEGLAAAHDVGLVHRDFKPDNVMVGADGRVRVMDFGLARLEPESLPKLRASRDDTTTSRNVLSEQLTAAGTLLGTPAYLAPELHAGTPADARSDQFAFGVTCYEALFRARPYEPADLLPGDELPQPKPPPDIGLPKLLERIVLRAAAIAPAARYPSMRALLDELAVDPGARRRRVLVALGALAVLGAGGFALHAASTGPAPCAGIGQRLAGVWDGPIRDAVHRAFLATKRPYAEHAFGRLAAALDAYTGKWTDAVTDSCKATRVRGEQPESALALREDCFDQRLQEVRALAHLLQDADARTVDKGEQVVGELDDLALCNNVPLLAAPGTPPPAVAEQVKAIRAGLAEARAEMVVGHTLRSLVLSQQQLDAANAVHWDPVIAEALLVRALGFVASASHEPATKLLGDATWTALRGKRDDVAMIAAEANALVIASGLGRPREAQVWIDLARTVAARVGLPAELLVHLDSAAGLVAAERGDLHAAIELHERALVAGRALFGDDTRVTAFEMDLGVTQLRAGMYDQAVKHLEQALTAREATVGEDHPEIAILLSNLARAYGLAHQPDKARAMFARAIALRGKLFGQDSFMMAAPLDNYAEFLGMQGEYADALAAITRAEHLAAPIGKDHPDVHQIVTDHAVILVRAQRFDEARAMLDELIRREESTASPILPDTEAARAELALAQKVYADAEAWAQRSVDGYVALGGDDNVALWKPLATLATAKVALGKPAEARPLLERALAIGGRAEVPAADLAPVRAALAALPAQAGN